MSKAPEHLRFAVLASDIVLFSLRGKDLVVRLMHVHRPPHFPSTWGLPGGLIRESETAEDAALRILSERGHVRSEHVHCEQLFTFSAINRDPRGRVVAVAYLALLPWQSLSPTEQADTPNARWVSVRDIPHLAYDHDHVHEMALERLRARMSYSTIVSKILPREFTLSELQFAYECVRGEPLDKRNFRKKVDALNVLTPLDKKRTGVRARPAQLFRFTSKKVEITPQL